MKRLFEKDNILIAQIAKSSIFGARKNTYVWLRYIATCMWIEIAAYACDIWSFKPLRRGFPDISA